MHINKIQEIVQNCGQATILGEQLQFSLETAQMLQHLDLILNADYKKYSSIVIDSWIKHAWRFVYENKFHFQGWNYESKHQRIYDTFLMDHFNNAGLTKTELKTMNRCRKYLQIISVSDITDCSGKKFQNVISMDTEMHQEPVNISGKQ